MHENCFCMICGTQHNFHIYETDDTLSLLPDYSSIHHRRPTKTLKTLCAIECTVFNCFITKFRSMRVFGIVPIMWIFLSMLPSTPLTSFTYAFMAVATLLHTHPLIYSTWHTNWFNDFKLIFFTILFLLFIFFRLLFIQWAAMARCCCWSYHTQLTQSKRFFKIFRVHHTIIHLHTHLTSLTNSLVPATSPVKLTDSLSGEKIKNV